MKCAIIGYGYWGKILEKYINISSKFQLSDIYDSKINGRTLEEILLDSTIECVFICTPVSTHYDLVYKSLEHKKYVFCEKPLCKSFEEAKKLFNKAMKEKMCLYTDLIYRVSPSINKIKELLSEIGELIFIDAKISQFGNFYKDDNVFEVIGIHMLSSIFHILDINTEDVKLKNVSNFNYDRYGNILHSKLEFSAKTVLCQVECNLLDDVKTRTITLYGKQGLMKFNMLSEKTVKIVKYEEKENGFVFHENSYSFDESNNINYVLDDFYNFINTRSDKNLKLAIDLVNFLNEIGEKYGKR